MIFEKSFLMVVAWGDYSKIVSTEIKRVNRWTVTYRAVFEYNSKLYETFYDVGSTELNEERPYYNEPDEIECDEVIPIEKMVTVYERR
jgi:hypothetical protein